MLFTYRYVNHSIEQFQVYLDHLVKEVWCQPSDEFELDSLHADLRAIIIDMGFEEVTEDKTKNIDWLHRPIKRIYELFRDRLDNEQRQQFSIWYDNNNDIENLCACDPARPPVTYEDIEAIDKELADELKKFCKSLFTDVIHLKPVQRRIGDIKEHFYEFSKENDEEKCPYCGISDITSNNLSISDAYDHYLPKSKYPFNTVNFRNLAPMCDRCNSRYKLAQDPNWHIDPANKKSGHPRKSFYSFANNHPKIQIDLTLSCEDIDKVQASNIDLSITSAGHSEEIEAWTEVFGIKERFIAKCCAKNDGKAWLLKITDECQNYEKSAEEVLASEIKCATKRPLSDSGFLKGPFLKACNEAGLI